jgi:hypothetical protein
MARKTLDEMMRGMGFEPSDVGPNVLELRGVVARQIENGLINRSAGTWAPGDHSAEVRAAAFLELERAIQEGRCTLHRAFP